MEPRKPDSDPVNEFARFLDEWKEIHGIAKGDMPLAFAKSPQTLLPNEGGGEGTTIIEDRVHHILRTLVERAEFRTNVLLDQKAFADHVEKHPARSRLLRAIHDIRIDFLSGEDQAKELTDEELIEGFRDAAMQTYYQIPDLSAIAPPPIDMCDLQEVAEFELEKLKKMGREKVANKDTESQSESAAVAESDPKAVSQLELDALVFALKETPIYVAQQWRKLTGLPYSFEYPPAIGTLTARMAPTPFRVNWSDKTYGGENQLFNRDVNSAPAAGGNVGESGGESVCDIATIKSLADNFPEAPDNKTDPHYTFPYDLGKREDIFYDYSVILPVRECGVLGLPYKLTRLSFTSVSVLAKKALTILVYLSQVKLDVLLGRRVRVDLQATLKALDNDLASNAFVSDDLIRRHRVKIAEV